MRDLLENLDRIKEASNDDAQQIGNAISQVIALVKNSGIGDDAKKNVIKSLEKAMKAAKDDDDLDLLAMLTANL